MKIHSSCEIEDFVETHISVIFTRPLPARILDFDLLSSRPPYNIISPSVFLFMICCLFRPGSRSSGTYLWKPRTVPLCVCVWVSVYVLVGRMLSLEHITVSKGGGNIFAKAASQPRSLVFRIQQHSSRAKTTAVLQAPTVGASNNGALRVTGAKQRHIEPQQ